MILKECFHGPETKKPLSVEQQQQNFKKYFNTDGIKKKAGITFAAESASVWTDLQNKMATGGQLTKFEQRLVDQFGEAGITQLAERQIY